MLFRSIVNSTKLLFLYLLIQLPSPKIKIPQNSNLGGIRFGVDEEGNYGYKKVGADTVTPFKSGDSNVYFLGKGTTFNIKTLFPEIYQQLTIDNFICQLVDSYNTYNKWYTSSNFVWSGKKIEPSWSYNATTGILDCSYFTGVYSGEVSPVLSLYNTTHSLNVYLIVGKINKL